MGKTYSPEDQALIDRVNAEHEAMSGKDRLWSWFGLSRASWLTLPRVLMHEMPDDWQKRMAVLLEEMDSAFPTWGAGGQLYVTAKKSGRFIPLPEWLCNYRRPDSAEIDAHRAKEF